MHIEVIKWSILYTYLNTLHINIFIQIYSLTTVMVLMVVNLEYSVLWPPPRHHQFFKHGLTHAAFIFILRIEYFVEWTNSLFLGKIGIPWVRMDQNCSLSMDGEYLYWNRTLSKNGIAIYRKIIRSKDT